MALGSVGFHRNATSGLVVLWVALTITLLGLATPASAGGVDELVADCPSGSEVAALRADLFIEVVDDPTAADGFVCHAADGSVDLTRLEERVIQALRVMQRVEFTRELPWTNRQLYAWLTDSIGGIRVKETTFSHCCDTDHGEVIVIQPQDSPGTKWSGYSTDPGLGDLSSDRLGGLFRIITHEARHARPGPDQPRRAHSCDSDGDGIFGDDNSVAELGSFGTTAMLDIWIALFTADPAFLQPSEPVPDPGRYRLEAIRSAQQTLRLSICDEHPSANLAIAADAPEEIESGATLQRTLTVTNEGPDPAPGVFAIHEPEVGLEFQAVSSTKGACVRRGGGSEQIRCELGELSVGETVRITTSHRVGAQPGAVLRGDGFAAISPVPDRDRLDDFAYVPTRVVAAPDPVPPAEPVPPQLPTGPKVDPTPGLSSIKPGKVKLRGLVKRGLPIRVRCSKECELILILQQRGKFKRALGATALTAGSKAIGRKRVVLEGAGSRKVRVELTKQGRKLAKRARRLKLTLRASDKLGTVGDDLTRKLVARR